VFSAQKYAQELSQSNTLDRDTIHLLFPNLNKLLNFQRRFLIRLEATAELAWVDQRWGILFTESVSPNMICSTWLPLCSADGDASILRVGIVLGLSFGLFLRLEQKEEEFSVYEPYCANYTNASELMLMEEQNLVVRPILTR
jgi:cell division control protein 24